MLGQIMEWFYHDLAGIQNDPGSPGFQQILIQPHPVGDITWTRVRFNSIRGKIVSDWKRDRGQIRLEGFRPGQHDGDRVCSGQNFHQSDGKRQARVTKPGREISPRGKWLRGL